MPCLNVSTNVNLDGVDTSAVLIDASSTIAAIIGKPEAYVMVVLKGSVPMAFGGSQDPAAYDVYDDEEGDEDYYYDENAE